jgi:hypothetical protein
LRTVQVRNWNRQTVNEMQLKEWRN